MYPRHKVFISCFYEEDGKYKRLLESYNNIYDIFIDCSVQEYDIDDYGLTSEQIRRIIRDQYIRDSTVTILLCGPNSRRRKHIDWELHATMYDSSINPQGGILVINVPPSNNHTISAPGDNEIISTKYKYRPYHNNIWLDEHFPDLPDRLFWNIAEGVPISIINWNDVSDPNQLSALIDSAYNRRTTNNYIRTPLRKRNS